MESRSETRIAMIGVTGAGKSALGNTILRKKKFISKCASDSVTFECEMAKQDVDGMQLLLVDTPGFQDTSRSVADIKREVARTIEFLTPGPHVFLIVLSPNRFSVSDRRCLEDIESLFGGDEFYRHAITVFTRRNEIYADEEWSSIHEFVQRQTCKDVKDVIAKCGNRVIAVENLGDKRMKEEESRRVLKAVGKLIGENRSYFSHAYFEAIMKMEAMKRKNVVEVEKAMDTTQTGEWCTIL